MGESSDKKEMGFTIRWLNVAMEKEPLLMEVLDGFSGKIIEP